MSNPPDRFLVPATLAGRRSASRLGGFEPVAGPASRDRSLGGGQPHGAADELAHLAFLAFVRCFLIPAASFVGSLYSLPDPAAPCPDRTLPGQTPVSPSVQRGPSLQMEAHLSGTAPGL